MYKRLCKKIQKNSLVLLGMSTKAVPIPRGETTLGARAIFHFCMFFTDVQHQLFHGFWNVLSHTGHLKILIPKVFMDDDGYNFWDA